MLAASMPNDIADSPRDGEPLLTHHEVEPVSSKQGSSSKSQYATQMTLLPSPSVKYNVTDQSSSPGNRRGKTIAAYHNGKAYNWDDTNSNSSLSSLEDSSTTPEFAVEAGITNNTEELLFNKTQVYQSSPTASKHNTKCFRTRKRQRRESIVSVHSDTSSADELDCDEHKLKRFKVSPSGRVPTVEIKQTSTSGQFHRRKTESSIPTLKPSTLQRPSQCQGIVVGERMQKSLRGRPRKQFCVRWEPIWVIRCDLPHELLRQWKETKDTLYP